MLQAQDNHSSITVFGQVYRLAFVDKVFNFREFEDVCTSFNEMQAQILQEQQKREAYENPGKSTARA